MGKTDVMSAPHIKGSTRGSSPRCGGIVGGVGSCIGGKSFSKKMSPELSRFYLMKRMK